MAVIQISKIQVRRGLQENLPQLSGGEFGWSVDERRLFIGNGTLAEGAPLIGRTEILTQNSDVIAAIQSYVYRGDESGYLSQTGPTSTTFIQRSLQHKIDEHVSVRDFGVKGDGTDESVAMQRAIDQIYPAGPYNSVVGVRRQLHIPAGTYNIGSTTLTLPPYANISGDGPQSTFITGTSAFGGIIKLRDSKGQVDADLGTLNAELPNQIKLSNLTLISTTDDDIAVIDSVTNMSFDRVNFVGGLTTPLLPGNEKAGIRVQSNKSETKRLSFTHCEFSNLSYGMVLEGNVTSTLIDNANFDTLYQGIRLVAANGVSPSNIKAVSSVFDNIAAQAIVSNDDSSIVSVYNHYKTVGYGNVISVTSSVASSSVISWDNGNNFGIYDTFERTVDDMFVEPLVTLGTRPITKLVTEFTAGTAMSFPGGSITLTDNTTANSTIIMNSLTSSVYINYSIVRDTAKRIGTIKLTHLSGTVAYDDEYNEIGSTGVTLNWTGNVSADTMTMRYSTTNTGSDAIFKYSVKTFI